MEPTVFGNSDTSQEITNKTEYILCVLFEGRLASFECVVLNLVLLEVSSSKKEACPSAGVRFWVSVKHSETISTVTNINRGELNWVLKRRYFPFVYINWPTAGELWQDDPKTAATWHQTKPERSYSGPSAARFSRLMDPQTHMHLKIDSIHRTWKWVKRACLCSRLSLLDILLYKQI